MVLTFGYGAHIISPSDIKIKPNEVIVLNNQIESVSKTANLINDVGPTAVILAVFILLFMGIMFYFMKMQQNITKQEMEQQRAILTHILDENKKLMAEKEKESVKVKHESSGQLLKEYSKINNMLKHNCMHFLKETSANRIAIYIFHNGMYGITGIPFFKFSCIAEQVTKYQYAKIKEHHDIPINLMGDMVDILLESREYYKYSDKCNVDEIDPIIHRLLNDDVDDFIIHSILDSNKNIIGLILAEFDKNDDSEVAFFRNRETIISMVRAVSPILEISNYNKVYNGGDEYK